MSAEVATIIGLVVMFIIATALPINMGALAFAAAFIIGGLFVNMPAKEVLAGFPGDLFVTLVGITYLFAIARNNGTIDWLVQWGVRAVRGHIAAIPWVMFFVTAALTAVGALSPAAVAIIAPIALRFAAQYKISPLLMGLMVIHGAQGGGFSPISVYGSITNGVVERAQLPGDDMALFLSSLLFNFLVSVVIFFVFGGRQLLRGKATETAGGAVAEKPAAIEHVSLDLHRSMTLLGLVALAVGALKFELNVGLVAISVATLLALMAPNAQKKAVDQVSWSTVLLISGVITYIAVLQKAGTVDMVSNSVHGIGIPLLGALLVCYVGGVVSAFASSVGVLGATIPLAVPFLLHGDVGPIGVVSALAIASTVVDVSPFSTNGALVVASAPADERDALYKRLLAYSAIVVVVGPLLAWLMFVVPGWG